jgi:ectoine hydroxylase-related dioxygenase (phytanoyl-CoA dioxygenase family)
MTTALAPANQQRALYEELGFIIVRSLLDPAVIDKAMEEAVALRERTDLISTRNLRCRWQTNVRTKECQFETFDPIIDLSPACEALAHDPGLLAVLAELYGEPACLFKDKLIYKPPGCPGYGLHQDWIAWDGFPRSFLTVLIPLEAAKLANGCTVVYPGYHLGGSLSTTDGNYHELPAETVDETVAVPLELNVGDVAIFGGFTPHRSAPNMTDGWRRQLYLSYNKISEGGDQRDAHYEEFHRWLRKKYAEYGKTEVYFE